MSLPSEFQQKFLKNSSESLNKLSSLFLELNTELKSLQVPDEILKKLDKVFKLIITGNQQMSQEFNSCLDRYLKFENENNVLREGKRKLEVLFSSGILFTFETEKKALMEIAIDTIVKELKADAGFIILTNEDGDIEETITKNMNPEENPEAVEMSTTVIKNTLDSMNPL